MPDTTKKPDLKELISPLLWDRDKDAAYYITLLQKEKPTGSEKRELQNLYIKILNYNNWHEVVKHFDRERIKNEILTDEVINGLFPRTLRKKYEFVRKVLSTPV